ncbi:hypothetical protein V4890_24195 [Ralstonia solanacearum species complex bacterium KE056]|uniref:hypothetical protein n=1 Tax=Ralstonia solanacearum species complex bacterium KE056 TaxID=3119585 RepID=UPI002FC39388
MKGQQLANGDELCRAIEQFSELEWRKFQARTVEVTLRTGGVHREDNSLFPPFTSVRFKGENPDLIEKIKLAVEAYKGAVQWHMLAHRRLALPGTNWVIRPDFVDELASEARNRGYQDVGRYIAENYPDLGPVAYADLLGLAEYVRKSLMR